MSKLITKIHAVAWHRNGVSGEGFYAVLFDSKENGLMLASLFDKPGYCAVYSVPLLQKGDIRFGSNSWRGDHFEYELRPMVEKWIEENGTGRIGPWALPVLSDDQLEPLPDLGGNHE